MARPIKVGIIGLGKMGAIRARELRRNPETELVCGADIDAAARTSFPDLELSVDWRDVIRRPVDAVFVCLPNRSAPAAVIEALDAGKHVFCEKPPGRCLRDVDAIVAAERRNPRSALKFGFNHRYHAGIQEAKRIVDGGRLGRILWLRGIYGKCGGAGFERSWRCSREIAGGGILLDQGIHMLDLFRFFCGDFVEVKSMVATAHWNIDVEDNAFALLRDGAGRIAMLHSSSTQWKNRFSLEIYLSEGYVSVNGILSSTRSYGDETVTVARKDSDAEGRPSEEIVYFDTDPSWALEIRDFVRSIREGTPVSFGTSAQARKAMELVFAIYQDDAARREPAAAVRAAAPRSRAGAGLSGTSFAAEGARGRAGTPGGPLSG